VVRRSDGPPEVSWPLSAGSREVLSPSGRFKVHENYRNEIIELGQAGLEKGGQPMSTTPLLPPVSPGSRKDKALEMDRMQDQFDLATGRKSKPTPWHTEKGLSQATKQALDSLEQQKKSGGFYHETEAMKKQQDAFDQTLKNIKDPGTGTWQTTPPTKKERLLAWHRSLGSPKHVVDAELKALEEQEARK